MSYLHFNTIKDGILLRMQQELPAWLSYHNVPHTLDVMMHAERIAIVEKITDTEDLFLLKIAALFHDSGFIYTYKGHEEQGCEIAIETLVPYGFNDRQLDTICGMIMATKIPQLPATKLEKILADADLDYIGREDFYLHSDALKGEYFHEGFATNEQTWNQLQLDFLEAHQYFTASSIGLRLPSKAKRVSEILAWLRNHRESVTY